MPTVTYPPPWEAGCGPADPALSRSFSDYTGSGYGTRGGTGEVGTINAGVSTPVTVGPQSAQVRFYVGSDGNLYALDNVTGKTFQIAPGGTVQPPIYSPTASVQQSEAKPTVPGSFLGQISPGGQWRWNGTGTPSDDWQPV